MKVFSSNATSVDLQLLVVKIIFIIKLRKEENLRISTICFNMSKITITIWLTISPDLGICIKQNLKTLKSSKKTQHSTAL